MTRFYIDKDEWWPVYTIVTDPFHYIGAIELTEEQHEDYMKALTRFKEWQLRLSRSDPE